MAIGEEGAGVLNGAVTYFPLTPVRITIILLTINAFLTDAMLREHFVWNFRLSIHEYIPVHTIDRDCVLLCCAAGLRPGGCGLPLLGLSAMFDTAAVLCFMH